MAPLVRMNASKAVKDRARTLESKANELHDVMQHNPSLQLLGRVATLVETKPGHWEVFSSCKPEDLPIDFSQMLEFEIKSPDNYRTIADATAAVTDEVINPRPSIFMQEHVDPAVTQEHVDSGALDRTSMDIHSPSSGQTLSPQHTSVPQEYFLSSPISQALSDQHKTAPGLPTLPIAAADSVHSSASDVPASNGPTMEYHNHSLPPTSRDMPSIGAPPIKTNPRSSQLTNPQSLSGIPLVL